MGRAKKGENQRDQFLAERGLQLQWMKPNLYGVVAFQFALVLFLPLNFYYVYDYIAPVTNWIGLLFSLWLLGAFLIRKFRREYSGPTDRKKGFIYSHLALVYLCFFILPWTGLIAPDRLLESTMVVRILFFLYFYLYFFNTLAEREAIDTDETTISPSQSIAVEKFSLQVMNNTFYAVYKVNQLPTILKYAILLPHIPGVAAVVIPRIFYAGMIRNFKELVFLFGRYEKKKVNSRKSMVQFFVYAALTIFVLFSFLVYPPFLQAKEGGAERYLFPVIVILLVGNYIINKGRQFLRLSAKEKLETDERSAVLILRSFHDESNSSYKKCEQHIYDHFFSRGNVIALGNPKDKNPRKGAHRDYIDEGNWQKSITTYIEDAVLIFYILGLTEGLQWELEKILLDDDLLKKTIFVDISSSWSSHLERMAFFLETLEAHSLPADPNQYVFPEGSLGFGIGVDGQPVFVTARFGDPNWKEAVIEVLEKVGDD